MTQFFYSDPHWGHEKILTFLKEHSTERVRPFDSLEEMTEMMIEKWNATIGKNDTVWMLGDLAFKLPVFHKVMVRLQGRKILILGNHDHFKLADYIKYFADIYAMKTIELGPHKAILTHIPIHDSQLAYRYRYNIHGHLHGGRIMDSDDGCCTVFPDPRYFCVSVENIDYTPISFEEVAARMEKEDPTLWNMPYDNDRRYKQ